MDTTHLILLAVAIVVLVGIASVVGRLLRDSGARTYPFVRIEALFSPAERSFFGVLSQLAGDRYVVFGKIRLADIIKPQPGLSP